MGVRCLCACTATAASAQAALLSFASDLKLSPTPEVPMLELPASRPKSSKRMSRAGDPAHDAPLANTYTHTRIHTQTFACD